MRFAVVMLSLVLLGGGSAQATTGRSGLYGLVTKGPLMPVCIEDQPCNGPAAHATVVFSLNGVAVARTVTTSTGHYTIRLAPGFYSVRINVGRRRPEPPSVRVRAGRLSHVDFSVDTGIR